MHYEESAKYFPQEFSLIFNTYIPRAEDEDKNKQVKGDQNLSVEHCELKQRTDASIKEDQEIPEMQLQAGVN